MKDAQERLDAGAKAFAKLIKANKGIAAQLRQGADEACEEGAFDLSAELRECAIAVDRAALDNEAVYARLRRLEIDDEDDIVRPAFGDK
jgi:hypothetical protein